MQLINQEASAEGTLNTPINSLGKDHEQCIHEAQAELAFTAVKEAQ